MEAAEALVMLSKALGVAQDAVAADAEHDALVAAKKYRRVIKMLTDLMPAVADHPEMSAQLTNRINQYTARRQVLRAGTAAPTGTTVKKTTTTTANTATTATTAAAPAREPVSQRPKATRAKSFMMPKGSTPLDGFSKAVGDLIPQNSPAKAADDSKLGGRRSTKGSLIVKRPGVKPGNSNENVAAALKSSPPAPTRAASMKSPGASRPVSSIAFGSPLVGDHANAVDSSLKNVANISASSLIPLPRPAFDPEASCDSSFDSDGYLSEELPPDPVVAVSS
jgi:hypothetical protein